MIAFRRSAGLRALLFAIAALPFIFGENWIPSTALIFLKPVLPITKPDALPFSKMVSWVPCRMIAQIGLPRRRR
jgi:hypothetical protein